MIGRNEENKQPTTLWPESWITAFTSPQLEPVCSPGKRKEVYWEKKKWVVKEKERKRTKWNGWWILLTGFPSSSDASAFSWRPCRDTERNKSPKSACQRQGESKLGILWLFIPKIMKRPLKKVLNLQHTVGFISQVSHTDSKPPSLPSNTIVAATRKFAFLVKRFLQLIEEERSDI